MICWLHIFLFGYSFFSNQEAIQLKQSWLDTLFLVDGLYSFEIQLGSYPKLYQHHIPKSYQIRFMIRRIFFFNIFKPTVTKCQLFGYELIRQCGKTNCRFGTTDGHCLLQIRWCG